MVDSPPSGQSAGGGSRQRPAPPPEPTPPDSRTPSPSSNATPGRSPEAIRSTVNSLRRFLAGDSDVATLVAAVQAAIPVLEEAAKEPDSQSNIEERISAIENTLQAIHKDIKAPKTYAAATTAPTAAPAPRAPQVAKTLPLRHEREVTVKAAGTEGRTYEEIVRKVNAAIGREAAVAARKLPSGDYAITCKTTEEKRILETDRTWTAEAFGENASIQKRKILVVAHGINKEAAEANQAQLTTQLRNQPGGPLEVLEAKLPRSAKTTPKKVTALYIAVATVQQAEQLCRDGLIWQYGYYPCEPFAEGAQLKQCYRCFRYGHISRVCRYVPRCGLCSSTKHDDKSCPVSSNREGYCCPACRGPHTAWSKECPVRQEQVQIAKAAYITRPKGFALPMQEPPKPTTEDWQTVQPRKRRATSCRTRSTGRARSRTHEAADDMDIERPEPTQDSIHARP